MLCGLSVPLVFNSPLTAPLEILLLVLGENEIYVLYDSLNWRKSLTLGLPFMLQYDTMQMRI